MADHRCICADKMRNALVRVASAIKFVCSRWERGDEGPDKEREIETARAAGKSAHKMVDGFAECVEDEPVDHKTPLVERYERALNDIRAQLDNMTTKKFSREACALQIAVTAVETDKEWECLT